ncbi:hypothetical protein DQG23_23480 [Paenibacillus contaminans]|uniref:Uncharacterized protein n=2 Tax=Paenibacillus contaminans TaxID=450362 RepID=A0A329MH72_9BACL|nr:hypothetical protein DQG23_23480 [Paenibacillus contaminans]
MLLSAACEYNDRIGCCKTKSTKKTQGIDCRAYELLNRTVRERYEMNEPISGAKAQAGDTIIIIANTNDHPFEIGQSVIVTDWYDFESADGEFGVEAIAHPEMEHWFIRHTDYRKA